MDSIYSVMGPTGTGKSSVRSLQFRFCLTEMPSKFTQSASDGTQEHIGSSLHSMTREIIVSSFIMNGLTVDLIDTPGFDDTTLSDTTVLGIIAAYLAELSVSPYNSFSLCPYRVIDWADMKQIRSSLVFYISTELLTQE